ncbi:MAG: hypothetical protein QOC70_1834, partial [Verrucomicrobiota bacterium]
MTWSAIKNLLDLTRDRLRFNKRWFFLFYLLA